MTAVLRHPIRAIVISDDARVRRALAGLLGADGRVQLIDEMEGCPGLDPGASRPCPEVVVIDLDRSEPRSGLREIARVRTRCPATAVVAVATSAGLERRARSAGADVFESKLATARAICDAVDRAIRLRRTISRSRPPGRRATTGRLVL